jgi:hypothetical protein
MESGAQVQRWQSSKKQNARGNFEFTTCKEV